MKKNVIIYGESKVGKSTLINAILDKECGDGGAAKTRGGMSGCTFEFKYYDSQYQNIYLYDTAGLSEGTFGTVTNEDAVDSLIKLLIDLSDSGGINLLIMCISKRNKLTKL